MKLNVAKVLATEAIKATMVKPLPKVRISTGTRRREQPPAWLGDPLPKTGDNEKTRLLEELNNDRIKVLKQRAILSSQNHKIVAEIEANLRKQSPSMANAFLEGELPMPELAEHAAKIEALTDQGAKIFDDIRYVEAHGKLPAHSEGMPLQELSEDVKSIQYDIRRLDDRIYKTIKKRRDNPGAKPSRVAMWNEKIAFDEARRTDLKHKLKKLQYESRA